MRTRLLLLLFLLPVLSGLLVLSLRGLCTLLWLVLRDHGLWLVDEVELLRRRLEVNQFDGLVQVIQCKSRQGALCVGDRSDRPSDVHTANVRACWRVPKVHFAGTTCRGDAGVGVRPHNPVDRLLVFEKRAPFALHAGGQIVVASGCRRHDDDAVLGLWFLALRQHWHCLGAFVPEFQAMGRSCFTEIQNPDQVWPLFELDLSLRIFLDEELVVNI
mmetsp:Transcript_3531/g.8507  ORF Transcript_3531/g.8507 Transcript_3531/m.8507 type:complete len:216 (-) Transcript_3531:926-1573(-)